MSGDQVIAGVYTPQQRLAGDALCSLSVTGVNLDNFNFAQLYAYAQVEGDNLSERARNAEHFAGKLTEKKLDNLTIRTILETQEVALPGESTGLVLGTDLVNSGFFNSHIHHTLYLKHDGLALLYDAGIFQSKPYISFAIPTGMLNWETIPALTNQQKAGLFLSLCNTLQSLHERSTVHGGIRPTVVMPCREREELGCKLLAAALIPNLDKALESGGGADLKDIFAFCSPQQLAGQSPQATDDIYSVGALLYYAFTGSAPWARQRSLFDLLESCKKGNEALGEQELQLLPVGINAIIQRACATEPHERYSSIEEMAGHIQEFIEGKLEVPASTPQAGDDLPPQTHASQGGLPFNEPEISGTTEEKPAAASAPSKAAIADITTVGTGSGSGSGGKIAVAAVIIAVLGIGGYFGYKNLSPTKNDTASSQEQPVDPAAEASAIPVNPEPAKNTAEPANNVAEIPEPTKDNTPAETPHNASDTQRARLVSQGNQAMKQKRYASAIDYFKQAQQLQATPDVASLQQAAQALLEKDRKFSQALAQAEQLMQAGELEKAQGQILLALGMAGYSNDETALKLAAAIRKKSFEKTLSEANAHLENGKWEEAQAAFAWALSIKDFENNDRAIAGRKKADKELEKLARKKEEEEKQKAARLSRYRAAMAEGTNLEGQGRWDDAMQAYQLALQIEGFEKDEAALKAQANAEKEAQKLAREKLLQQKKQLTEEYEKLMALARAEFQAGNWIAAENAFGRAMEVDGYAADEAARRGRQQTIDASAADIRKEKYYRMVEESLKLINHKEQKKADAMLREALTIKGFERGELARQGIMLAELTAKFTGKHEKYIQHILKAQELMQTGNPKQAALEYGRALVSEPDNEQALLMRGVAHLQSGSYDKAIASFQQTIEQKPNSFPAYAGIAAAQAVSGKFAAALQTVSETALKAKTAQEKGWVQNAQGWLIFDEGRGGIRKNGVDSDNAKALEFFRQSYSEGFAGGGNNLAICLIEGKGVRRDREEGIKILQDAAAKGSPQAQFNLGLAYYEGEGIDRSYTKAHEYFLKSAEGGLSRAWGRLSYMHYRGYGVERDREKSNEYARRNGGEQDRNGNYETAGPGSGFIPENINNLKKYALDNEEMAEQFEGIMDVGRKLMEKGEPRWAEKVFNMAMLLPGYADNAFAKAAVAKAQTKQQDLKQLARAATQSLQSADKTPEAADNAANESAALPEGVPTANQPNKTAINHALVIKSKVPGIRKNEFSKEYQTLLEQARKAADLKKWGIAEQVYRMALSVPGNPDEGTAMSGLQSATDQKKELLTHGKYTPSDYEAVLAQASVLLREGKWPEALHMFEYALSLEGFQNDPVAKSGIEIIQRCLVLQQTASEPAPITKGDNRDMSSYKLAIQQAQQFMNDKNYTAAIQMADIVLKMKGFEDDKVAAQLLAAAKLAKSQEDNSPEALRLKREQNKDLYEQMLLTANMHRQNRDFDKALKAVELANKLPGYEGYAPLKKLEEEIKQQSGGAATTPAIPTAISPEHRAQHLALMQKGREAMENKDWILAEESFRLALQIEGFENDKPTLAALDSALKSQGKDPAQLSATPPLPEQNRNFVNEEQNMDILRFKAQFEALISEATKQFELQQYEVAEAILKEALKVKGYENNPKAQAMLQRSQELKPKAEEIKIPEHIENPPVDATSDVKMQAQLLLTEGDRLRAARKIREALRTYSNALDLDPENIQLLVRRGDTRASLGMFDQAMLDYEKVLKNPAADGDVQSHVWNNTANIYYYGKKDLPKAVEYYLKAAQAGNAASMNSLGVCYGSGKGVPEDKAKSLEWYKQAAAKGYSNAMLNLGMAYQNGWGTAVDGTQAHIWYERAMKNNIPRAYVRMALLYEEGLGVDKNPEKAAQLRAQAKEMGYTRER